LRIGLKGIGINGEACIPLTLALSHKGRGNLVNPPPLEGVSQLCFDFVAAIFRLRKLLEFNKRFSQTEVCGYKKPNYDTVS
jgi:hypothetical protein